MQKPHWFASLNLEIVIAFLIAIVSTTLALAAWRSNLVSSSAGDASRHGILDTLKRQSAANEDWRATYQEAGYAENYAVYQAEVQALEASDDPAAAAQAANLRQYMLPSLQTPAQPLASDPVYQNADGTYNLSKRFNALEAATPDLRDLDPRASFVLAGRYYAEQRWLTVAAVLLAVSLFWLALAEVGGKRLRMATVFIGVGVYTLGLVLLIAIEVISVVVRGGVL
jgi:hypothetical protein